MSTFTSALSDLFSFLIDAMGDIATFFTTNLIGQIILGVALFSVVVRIVTMIVNKIH